MVNVVEEDSGQTENISDIEMLSDGENENILSRRNGKKCMVILDSDDEKEGM